MPSQWSNDKKDRNLLLRFRHRTPENFLNPRRISLLRWSLATTGIANRLGLRTCEQTVSDNELLRQREVGLLVALDVASSWEGSRVFTLSRKFRRKRDLISLFLTITRKLCNASA